MEHILFVDDEANILEGFQRQFRKQFQVHTALGGEQGLKIVMANGPFAVVVSDMGMPGMDGVQFLTKVREMTPNTIRMMLTGTNDLDTAMEAVNQGEIFRFLTKPCSPQTMTLALEAGIKQCQLIRAEKELLEDTLTGCLQALSDVLSMVNPEAFGRASRLTRYVIGLAQQMGVADIWQLEIGVALSQIGCVILPDPIIKKINAGESLTSHETQAYHQHPCTGADILAHIPRMDEVANIIMYQHKHFDGSGTPHNAVSGQDISLGARLLKVALDFDTLRMQDYPRSEAFEQLEARQGWYDPAILQALKLAFVPDQKFQWVSLSLRELRPHMVLAEGIYDEKKNLLVAKGQDLAEWMVAHLKQLAEEKPIREPIRVIVPDPTAEEEATLQPMPGVN